MYDIWYVRCLGCERIKAVQAEKGAKLCFGCYDEVVEEGMGGWKSQVKFAA